MILTSVLCLRGYIRMHTCCMCLKSVHMFYMHDICVLLKMSMFCDIRFMFFICTEHIVSFEEHPTKNNIIYYGHATTTNSGKIACVLSRS